MPRSPHDRRPSLFLSLAAVTITLAAGCGGESADPSVSAGDSGATATRADRLERLLGVLAADSMEGRRAGTEGIRQAADFLATELERYGVEPVGEDGYFQPVSLARVGGEGGRLALPSAELDFDTLPQEWILDDEVNVVGLVPGADPEVADEVVVVGAHYDHLGIGPPVDGDSIYNGADDDGTGTVAVLEIARDLAEGPAPRRTVLVLLSTAEEQGLLGTRWYIEHPLIPLEQTVADFQIEMIGRPDSLAGGPGRGWLTGYERTTMGDQLSAAGSPIVADPRPEMRFFFRSDNLPFAEEGIPAHTLSSYNLHTDYHTPSDEVDRIDFEHMATLVEAAIEAVRLLADGPRPEWEEGGREGLRERP
ncbi:MAG: M20/M25/M40 family metallo-hydrolase [Gemmatimonadota bacterium]|nr:M20/M25/M40 family metallo-hydrolase [Gemmatimonadota bacterium]